MTTKKIAPAWVEVNYRAALHKLRRYYSGYEASDGYDLRSRSLIKSLTRYQKQKIRKQLQYISHLHAGVSKRIYRAKTKKNIDLILKAQGVTNIPRNLKVALVPDIAGYKTSMKYLKPRKLTAYDNQTKKQTVLIQLAPVETITMGVTRRYINISKEYLLHNTLEAIQESIKLIPADFYTIQAGADHEIYNDEYRIRKDDTPTDIEKKIKRLQLKYGNENEGNYWGYWLGGLIAYTYPEQSNYDDYVVSRSMARLRNRRHRIAVNKRNDDRRKSIRTIKSTIKAFKKVIVKREAGIGVHKNLPVHLEIQELKIGIALMKKRVYNIGKKIIKDN